MKYRKYPNWVIITNKEIPFPYRYHMSWQCQSQDDLNATLDYIGHFANYDEEKDQAVLSIIPLQALQHILSTWIWKSTNEPLKNGTQNTDHPAHQTPLDSQIQNWYT